MHIPQPHHEESELATLGSILLAPESIHQIAERVTPQDFFNPILGDIFSRMLKMRSENKPIDSVFLESILIEKLASQAVLQRVMAAPVSTRNGPQYAGIVREYAKRREAILNHWDQIQEAGNVQEPFAYDEFESAVTLEDAVYAYLSEFGKGKARSRLVTTGILDLDAGLAGGYELGEMFVLAARPSHGKSAVALQMAHAANADGFPVVFISEEMPASALAKRTIQFASEVPEEDWEEQHGLVAQHVGSHFESSQKTYIVENCGTTRRVIQEIESHVRNHGVKVAIVDYAQLFKNEGKSRYEITTNTSLALKSVSRRLGIAVICLCQINREIEKRSRFVPVMSDLKETGQFEQDADVIVFLVWPHRINSDLPANDYQIFIAKNKNRAIVEPALDMKFNPSRQMVEQEKVTGQDGWPTDYGFGDSNYE